MVTRSSICILVVALAMRATVIGGEQQSLVKWEVDHKVRLTGNARVDLFGQKEIAKGPKLGEDSAEGVMSSHKSPWLAGALSLALPGTGEFYAESYWKAAAFFAIEVVAWTVAYSNDRKGDRKTESFQDFANQHWSVRRYAEWSLANATKINPDVIPSEFNVFDASGAVNWVELNKLERAIGNWYSHTLPPFGDQQYYELIGKYPQYNQGWDDATSSTFTFGDPLTQNFQFYSGERGKANDFYNTASTFVVIALVNHIISAVDAALSASSFNSFHARVDLERPPGIGIDRIPVLKMFYSF